MRSSARRRQRVLALGGAIVYVRCSARCRVFADGRLLIGKRVYRLRRATKTARAGERVRLRVRLTARSRRALRAVLRDGRRPKLRIGVRARDAGGDRSPLVRRTIRVRP